MSRRKSTNGTNGSNGNGHPTRAIGYVRISVDRPDETSTTTQEERIRAYCTAHGLDLVDVIVEAGRSAYKDSRTARPGLGRARAIIAAGAADALVTWKLDRVGRNTSDVLALVNELRDKGAAFASVTEQFDTSTPTGRLMLTMLAALAEMESAQKSDRVLAWHEFRYSTGSTPTGPRPFGYHRERNELHIVDDEAAVIRDAALRVLDGESLRSITAAMDAAGVLGKNGKPITHRGLRAILVGGTVAGRREVADDRFIVGTWEPILDVETWEAVRELLLDPKRTTGPGNARRWLLTGIVCCGRCAGATPMVSKPHVSGQRYTCPKCHLSAPVAQVDEVVVGDLLALLDRAAWQRLRTAAPTTGLDGSSFAAAMDMLTGAFVRGEIDATQLAEHAEGLRRQQTTESLPPELPDVDDIGAAWPSLDLAARRLVIEAATESLTIGPAVRGRSTFDPQRISFVPVA